MLPHRTKCGRKLEDCSDSNPKRIKLQSGAEAILPSVSASQSAVDTTKMRRVKVGDRIFTISISEWSQRSPYFMNLLGRDFAEGGHETIALDGSSEAFDVYAKCAAGIELDLSQLDISTFVEAFRMADYFGDDATRGVLVKMMKCPIDCKIDSENVLEVLETAWRFNLQDLIRQCFLVISEASHRVIEHEDFVRLSAESAKVVLSLSTLNVPETKVLEAIVRWDAIRPNREGKEMVLGQLRLHRFSRKELREVVMPLGLIDESEINRHLYGDILDGCGRGRLSSCFLVNLRGMEFLEFYNIPSQVPEALRKLTTEVCASSSAYSKMMIYHVDLGEYNKFDEILLIMDNVNKSIHFRIHTGDAEIAPEDFKDIVWVAIQPSHMQVSNLSRFTWSFNLSYLRFLRICAFSPRPLNFSRNLWVRRKGINLADAE